MKIAIYPGSFDPITNGHLDIINRATKLFDKVYVCIARNLNKKTFFTDEERLLMVKETLKDRENVEVILTKGIVVKVARELKATAIIRGLRAVTDFEYEFQLAAGNEYIDSEIETVFLMASPSKSFISSSSIKEFFAYGVDITNLVPSIVQEEFKKKENK